MTTRAGSRSSRIPMRRALLILVCLHRGDASRQELIQFVAREADDPAVYGSRPEYSFQKDLSLLRGLGFGISYSRQHDAYHLGDMEIPLFTLALPPEECATLGAVARAFVGSPLEADIQKVMARIEDALPLDCRPALHQPPPRTFPSLAVLDDLQPHGDTIRLLERAHRRRQQVRFTYHSPQHPEPRQHIVEVQELTYREGHLYCEAHAPALGRAIAFRVDRIEPGSAKALPTRVPGPRSRRPHTLRYRLSPQIARYGATPRFAEHREEVDEEGWIVVTAEAEDLFWAAKTLLKYGEHCQVLEPPRLVAEMQRTVEKMRELYGLRE